VLKKLKKKASKISFARKENRQKVIKALSISQSGSELISIVAVVGCLRGDKENNLALEKARQFKLDSMGWAMLFEKSEDKSELKKIADTMSYKLSPLYDLLCGDDEDDDDEVIS
jgi:hypothetical protein